jgi:hypothetical protein
MKIWITIALLTVGFLLTYAYFYKASKPESTTGPFVACGQLVQSRDIARGWRKDCGFFPGPTAPPDPMHAPAPRHRVRV